jgi:hypothetical protein
VGASELYQRRIGDTRRNKNLGFARIEGGWVRELASGKPQLDHDFDELVPFDGRCRIAALTRGYEDAKPDQGHARPRAESVRDYHFGSR